MPRPPINPPLRLRISCYFASLLATVYLKKHTTPSTKHLTLAFYRFSIRALWGIIDFLLPPINSRSTHI